eukprot:TRINITY_DN2688_c0_g1_i1.p2 TRINITY_DN2688_c0_g1~~TRINITY_DN2688_c0_g1_i1.p2  ORF type:complete len:171 (+),score=33.19 TRINITY_DN2688_c0_g1_i1:1346-1858(+)
MLGEASSTLSVATGSVKSPASTYYTALNVDQGGIIDMTNQTELITVECLTINGTIRVNMSLVDTSTRLTNIDVFKFTCSSTNISSIAMDIITSSECQSSYQIREKIVGRVRTVNVDIDIECPTNPNSSSNQPESPSSSSNTPDKPSLTSSASSFFVTYVALLILSFIFIN